MLAWSSVCSLQRLKINDGLSEVAEHAYHGCGQACRAEIKATDFGLSIFFKPKERFNELVGSPYYVAPEVLKKNYSFEADMWSLGVILYILLSGLPPFWGDNEEQIFKMVLKGKVDFETDPWPKISPQAKDLVKQLLQMDTTKRCVFCVRQQSGIDSVASRLTWLRILHASTGRDPSRTIQRALPLHESASHARS